jgi:hypothetical protein
MRCRLCNAALRRACDNTSHERQRAAAIRGYLYPADQSYGIKEMFEWAEDVGGIWESDGSQSYGVREMFERQDDERETGVSDNMVECLVKDAREASTRTVEPEPEPDPVGPLERVRPPMGVLNDWVRGIAAIVHTAREGHEWGGEQQEPGKEQEG